MEQLNPQGAADRKFSPIQCALSHLLVFGGAYLYLRLYKRFFIFFGAMIIIGLIPVPYLSFVVLIAAMIDTYLQTKGINEGKVQQEPFNNPKHLRGTVLIILAIIASFLGYSSFLAWK